MMTPQDKPKSRLEAHAPRCSKCKVVMKVRILLPGRKFDEVDYRCEECGAEVLRSVPRAW
jgi:MinD superfamily P-loop ATPase